MGAFDHPEWTYDGAFEQLFGLGSGEFEQKFSKNSNAPGITRGGGGECLSFDLTDTLRKFKFRSRHGTKIITKASPLLSKHDIV